MPAGTAHPSVMRVPQAVPARVPPPPSPIPPGLPSRDRPAATPNPGVLLLPQAHVTEAAGLESSPGVLAAQLRVLGLMPYCDAEAMRQAAAWLEGDAQTTLGGGEAGDSRAGALRRQAA